MRPPKLPRAHLSNAAKRVILAATLANPTPHRPPPQVLRDPNARVLLLAPSNTAADQLALRLMGPGGGQPPSTLLRVNAYQRAREDVPR